MKRRSVIATAAALPLLGGCLEDLGPESGGDAEPAQGKNEPPFAVATVDGPGSEAGTVSVPTEGQVQLVNCIRTTCPTSRAMLSRVGEARDRLEESHDVGPGGTVHVMTLVNGTAGAQPSESELADWWAEQDGDWTIGIDDSGALFDHHEVAMTPTTFAVDGEGEVHWRDEGGTTANNLVGGVETALEAGDETP